MTGFGYLGDSGWGLGTSCRECAVGNSVWSGEALGHTTRTTIVLHILPRLQKHTGSPRPTMPI